MHTLPSRNSLGNGALVFLLPLPPAVCEGPRGPSSSPSGCCIDTLRDRLPEPITAKVVEVCLRGVFGAKAIGSLAGDEGADLKRCRGSLRSKTGVRWRIDADGVVVSLSSNEGRLVSREEGRTRSGCRCSRSVSEPEPPRGETEKDARELVLAVDEDDEDEKFGGRGDREREDNGADGVESDERE